MLWILYQRIISINIAKYKPVSMHTFKTFIVIRKFLNKEKHSYIMSIYVGQISRKLGKS